MELSKINEQIAHLSKVFADIILERGFLDSKIFPVNAYICVAFYQTYERLYDVMSMVWERVSPEDLAKRSKRLLSPINALSITYLWLYYSLARMGVIYNKCGGDPSKEPAEKREQWRFMLEHWYRLATNYFDSGKPTVASSGKKNIALSEESLKWIKDHLQPVDPDQTVRARRAIGSVDLYAFLEECDARAKIVNHGPYPMGNDEILVISEYINLYDGRGRLWLPWSATEAKLPTSTLGVAMTIRGARATFNDIGTMTVEPADYSKFVTNMVAYTEKGGGIVEVPLEDLQAYADAAERAHMELYMKFSQMDRKDLIIAGATAYWRGFARYTDQVGITDEVDWNLSKTVLDEYLPYFLKNDEDPAFSRIKKKIIKMKALPFLKEKDPILYYLP
ncbi:MAG: hypothetical protein QXS54_09840 [Candidatus Methanomethylicaceae archaeon]